MKSAPFSSFNRRGEFSLLAVAVLVACALARLANAGPLEEACGRSDLEEVRALLRDDPTGTSLAAAKGRRSALHWAVKGRASKKEARLEIVRLMLDRSADVQAADENGETVLQAACQPGWDGELLELLLQRGAAIDRDVAAKGNFLHGGAPLMQAVARGDVALVEFLLSHRADPNAAHHCKGETPLMAVFRPPVTPYRWTDFSGERRRDDAVHILTLLIGKGADVQRKNADGEQALHYAAAAQHLPAIRLLLAKGATAATLTGDGRTVLHFAASNPARGDREAFSALLAASKLAIDVADKGGWTPLHSAVASAANTAVQSLLLLGANPALHDSKDKRPLDLDKFTPLEPATLDMLRRYTPAEEPPAEPPKNSPPRRLVI